MMPMLTPNRLLLLTTCSVCMGLCAAEVIPCTVTQDEFGTKYSVRDYDPTGCRYQWLNATDYVLANQRDRTDDVVANKTHQTLYLFECQLEIRYNRICNSEGKKHQSTCSTNCSFSGSPKGIRGKSRNFGQIIVPAVLVPVAVVMIIAIFVVRRKSRANTCSDGKKDECNNNSPEEQEEDRV